MKTEETQVNTLNTANELNEFQANALREAEEQLEALRKEISNKKYLIDLNKKDIDLIEKFNALDAQWKFTECLGVIELEKEIRNAKKEKVFYANAVAVEAMYYYLSKVEGRGKTTNTETFENVDDFIRVLKAFTSGKEKIKTDGDRLSHAEFVVAARREGIEAESPVETTEN